MKMFRIATVENPRIWSQKAMLSVGADGYLRQAVLARIPLVKISGLDPEPSSWVDAEGQDREYKKGTPVTKPIELRYQKDSDMFILYGGNHRIKQAKINGEPTILAFVEVEGSNNCNDFFEVARKYPV